MKTPLIPIKILSVYKNKNGDSVSLPKRMALCTQDTSDAIQGIQRALAEKGGRLVISDMFRSYEMQSTAHNDYITGRKQAFSPGPGSSFHEAGRAFDIDLSALTIPLAKFWEMAAMEGVRPIIPKPDAKSLEAWHFECRGSHQLLYDYYAARARTSNLSPYCAAAASAILAVGIHVEYFGTRQVEAAIQSCLIRLGKDIGNMDGKIGPKTQAALKHFSFGYDLRKLDWILSVLEDIVKITFGLEY